MGIQFTLKASSHETDHGVQANLMWESDLIQREIDQKSLSKESPLGRTSSRGLLMVFNIFLPVEMGSTVIQRLTPVTGSGQRRAG